MVAGGYMTRSTLVHLAARSNAIAEACFQLAQQCGHDGAKCKHYIAGYKRFAARSVMYNEMFWLAPRDGYDA